MPVPPFLPSQVGAFIPIDAPRRSMFATEVERDQFYRATGIPDWPPPLSSRSGVPPTAGTLSPIATPPPIATPAPLATPAPIEMMPPGTVEPTGGLPGAAFLGLVGRDPTGIEDKAITDVLSQPPPPEPTVMEAAKTMDELRWELMGGLPVRPIWDTATRYWETLGPVAGRYLSKAAWEPDLPGQVFRNPLAVIRDTYKQAWPERAETIGELQAQAGAALTETPDDPGWLSKIFSKVGLPAKLFGSPEEQLYQGQVLRQLTEQTPIEMRIAQEAAADLLTFPGTGLWRLPALGVKAPVRALGGFQRAVGPTAGAASTYDRSRARPSVPSAVPSR